MGDLGSRTGPGMWFVEMQDWRRCLGFWIIMGYGLYDSKVSDIWKVETGYIKRIVHAMA
jgi:hypothetical protein